MRGFKPLLILIIALFCSQCLPAQELRKATVVVDSVFERGDSMFVLLNGGSLIGLQRGMIGYCYNAIDEENPYTSNKGAGTITRVTEFSSECLVATNEANQPFIDRNNYFIFEVSLPPRRYPNQFFDLALEGIVFYSYYTYIPFYELWELVQKDSPGGEAVIIESILDDLRQVSDSLKSQPNYKELSKPLTFGRFEGRSPAEVLQGIKKADIENYLLYVRSYPESFRGKHSWFAVKFVDWINGGYHSFLEIKRDLFPIYRNKELFASEVKKYKRSILGLQAADYLVAAAARLDAAGQSRQAREEMEFARAIANAADDSVGKLVVHHFIAQSYQDSKEYGNAIRECEIMYGLARSFDDRNSPNYKEYKSREISAIQKKAYCEYLSKSYAESRKSLALVEALNRKYKDVIGFEQYLSGMTSRYELEGYVDYITGRYENALVHYANAIKHNDSSFVPGIEKKNGGLNYFLGLIYERMQNFELAQNAFIESYRSYKNSNDLYNTADVLTHIANSYFDNGKYAASLKFMADAYVIYMQLEDDENAGYAKSVMGSAFWNLGKYDSAIAAHDVAIRLRKDSLGISHSWKALGGLYQISGMKSQALNAYRNASRLARSSDSALSQVYIKIGEVYHNDEHYQNAIDYYDSARLVSSKPTPYLLYSLANTLTVQDTAKARKFFLECRELSRRESNFHYLIKSTISLVRLAYNSQNEKLGRSLFADLLKTVSQTDRREYRADILSLRAFLSLKKNELDSARHYHSLAAAIYDSVNKVSYAWELMKISDIHFSKGEYDRSLDILSVTTKLCQDYELNIELGSALSSLAFVYAFTGEYAKGMEAQEKAEKIFVESGNGVRLADALWSKSMLYKIRGNFRASLETLFMADSIYDVEGLRYHKMGVLNNIGVTYYNQDDWGKALEYFNRSAEYIQKDVVDESFFLNNVNRAECLYYLHKTAEAEKILVDNYPRVKDGKMFRLAMPMAIILGKIHLDKKLWDRARQFLLEARGFSANAGEKERMVETLVALGKLEKSLNKMELAGQYFREATSIARQYDVSAQDWITFYEAGLYFYELNLFDSAIANLKEAVAIVQKKSENIFGGTASVDLYNNDPRKRDMYGRLVSALIKVKKNEEALYYANRNGVVGLQVLSGPPALLSADKEKNEALKKAFEFTSEISGLEKAEKEMTSGAAKEIDYNKLVAFKNRRAILEEELQSYIRSLRSKYADIDQYFVESVNPGEFYNYKGELPQDVAVILYLLNGYELITFTLTNEELDIQSVDLDASFYKAIQAFRLYLKDSRNATHTGPIKTRTELVLPAGNYMQYPFMDVSTALYRILIEPIAHVIKDKKRLCIIPNGSLSNFAFQCLGKRDSTGKFVFLLRDYGIFYSNQINIFKFTKSPTNFTSFSAFGVPDSTLTFNQDEVKKIGRILEADSTVYADNRATERLAKNSLTNKKIVHFATHGTLDYEVYENSYLKFLKDSDTSGGNEGRLRIREMERLEIKGVDLVTLSACETAVDSQYFKGWSISPVHTLIKRRVKSVVASLWKVDDEATSILMESFYTNMRAGMDKVEALKQAQVALSEDKRFSHPFFWGAFALFGDWR